MSRPDYIKQIENRILDAPPYEVFITADFLDIADTQAVNKALSRLSAEKMILRISHGIYYRLVFSAMLQEYVSPHMETIAKAIARKNHWTIAPCGDAALNMLGLSPQVVAVHLFASSGPSNIYIIDYRELRFEHTVSRDIVGLSHITVLVVLALKTLGPDYINDNIIHRLTVTLSPEDKVVILNETQHCTAWVFKCIKQICA